MDLVWQAYFDNPNRAYIQQFLEIINQNDKVMFTSYEYLNRMHNADMLSRLQGKTVEPNLSDLISAIQESEKKEPGFSIRVSIVTAAMWSMDSNVKNHPQVKEDFLYILKSNPNLDYGKKINKMLGH